MDFLWLYKRTRLFLFRPVSAWEIIKNEPAAYQELIRTYALPLITLVCISIFIGAFIFDSGFNYAFFSAAISFATYFVCLYITGALIFKMASNLKIDISKNQIFVILIYSLTAFHVFSALAGIHYSTGFIKIFGAYSVFLFYRGIITFTNTSEDNKIIITVAASFIYLVLYFSLKSVLFQLYNLALS